MVTLAPVELCECVWGVRHPAGPRWVGRRVRPNLGGWWQLSLAEPPGLGGPVLAGWSLCRPHSPPPGSKHPSAHLLAQTQAHHIRSQPSNPHLLILGLMEASRNGSGALKRAFSECKGHPPQGLPLQPLGSAGPPLSCLSCSGAWATPQAAHGARGKNSGVGAAGDPCWSPGDPCWSPGFSN